MLSNDWGIRVLQGIYKTFDYKECINYRAIVLLSAAVKMSE